MDFHPSVTRPAHSGLRIPLYDKEFFKYDPQQPFSSYPTQKGFASFADDIFHLPVTDALSALQSWLFFGLMTEIFDSLGVAMSCEDFIVEESGSRYVTVKSLRRYLWFCIGNIKNMWFDYDEGTSAYLDESFGRRIDNNEIQNRINNALDIANGMINGIMGHCVHNESTSALEALLLSLIYLVETLGDARENWDIFPNHFKVVAWEYDSVPLLTNLLHKAGWCHYGIKWLQNRFVHMSTLYFVTFFDQKILGRNHTNCTPEICSINIIDKDTYVTKHTGICDCQHVGAEVLDGVLRILEKGEIPVLSILSSSSRICLRVKSTKDVDVYVAISHVWSDGLGNPSANSLPSCQLLRLQKSVNDLYPNTDEQTWFWIDTICVPLMRKFRNLALQKMADVYRGANHVLVQDSSLLASTINASNTEILARIKCSPWSRRLWTFQESMLARGFRLVFQFQDGYFRMHENFLRLADDDAFNTMAKSVVKSVSEIEQEGTTSRILRAIACFSDTPQEFRASIEQRFPDFPTSTDNLIFEWLWRSGAVTGDLLFMDGWRTYRELASNSRQQDICALGQGLKNRQTSRPEDEAFCLGILLGIDVQPLFNKSGQDRMKYLFQSVSLMRPAIVFSDGPRIEEDGFRWAPLSFLRPERHPREPGYHGRGMYADRHNLGLLVNFDGFILPKLPASNAFTIATEGQNYTIHLQPSIQPRQSDKLAVIHELRLSELKDKNFSTKAILVELTHIEDGIQFTRFCAVGRIIRAIEHPDDAVAVFKPTSSRWCIG